MPRNAFAFRRKIRNWPEHNRALVRYGHLTLWFYENAVTELQNSACASSPGRPRTRAGAAFEYALTVKSVFQLGLRSTQGLLGSTVAVLALRFPMPDYSTRNRRKAGLAAGLPNYREIRPWHVGIDAIGLRACGILEWRARGIAGAGPNEIRRRRRGSAWGVLPNGLARP